MFLYLFWWGLLFQRYSNEGLHAPNVMNGSKHDDKEVFTSRGNVIKHNEFKMQTNIVYQSAPHLNTYVMHRDTTITQMNNGLELTDTSSSTSEKILIATNTNYI